MDFVFLCEIPKREEPSYILLCEELKRRGYSAEYLLNTEWCFKPYKDECKVLITNDPMNVHELAWGVHAIVGQAKKVVNLRWEQAYSVGYELNFNDGEYMCKTARSLNYFAWGDFYYDRMLGFGVDPDHMHKVGNINMDLVRPEFAPMYLSREEVNEKYDINPDTKLLLFISSFGFINVSKERYEEALRYRGKEETEAIMKYENDCQTTILDWFEKLLQEKDDITVVYRPHPASNESERLDEMMAKYPNFKSIPDYNVQQWIMVSDEIAMVNSSTIVDCYFAKKECLIIRPVELPGSALYPLYNGVNEMHTYEEFVDAIDNGWEMGSGVITRYYDNNDDYPSYMRICDALEKVLKDDKYNVDWDPEELVEVQKEAAECKRLEDKRARKEKMKDVVVNATKGYYEKHPSNSKVGSSVKRTVAFANAYYKEREEMEGLRDKIRYIVETEAKKREEK